MLWRYLIFVIFIAFIIAIIVAYITPFINWVKTKMSKNYVKIDKKLNKRR
jgi:uncharacterized Tic20 family protein